MAYSLFYHVSGGPLRGTRDRRDMKPFATFPMPECFSMISGVAFQGKSAHGSGTSGALVLLTPHSDDKQELLCFTGVVTCPTVSTKFW